MQIEFYVINLDRSPDRLEAVQRDAALAGVHLIRVPAVEGKSVPEDERTLLDRAGFLRLHGKRPLAGEYGCYASHLQALDHFLAGNAGAAVVIEDDASLEPGVLPVIERIAAKDDWDLVKLVHHRLPLLRRTRTLGGGYRLGSALFGPTGSSAAYLVSRKGAERLRTSLRPMRLPFDIALERGWHHGLRVRHISPDLVAINPVTSKTVLTDGLKYREMKLKPWRRLSTLAFRTADLARRVAYAAARRGS